MLMPKKVKHRKVQRGRRRGKAYRGSKVSFGDYGLKVLENGWITARQIEAARIAMTRFVKRGGKIWIRVFPAKPITKKPAETRMGKGKGAPEDWVAVVKPGKIIYEMEGCERGHRQGGHAPRGPQAAAADPFRPSGDLSMKPGKIRDRSIEELELEEAKLKEQLFKLRFQVVIGQAENPLKIRTTRKDLARVKTILNEKRRAGDGAARG